MCDTDVIIISGYVQTVNNTAAIAPSFRLALGTPNPFITIKQLVAGAGVVITETGAAGQETLTISAGAGAVDLQGAYDNSAAGVPEIVFDLVRNGLTMTNDPTDAVDPLLLITNNAQTRDIFRVALNNISYGNSTVATTATNSINVGSGNVLNGAISQIFGNNVNGNLQAGFTFIGDSNANAYTATTPDTMVINKERSLIIAEGPNFPFDTATPDTDNNKIVRWLDAGLGIVAAGGTANIAVLPSAVASPLAYDLTFDLYLYDATTSPLPHATIKFDLLSYYDAVPINNASPVDIKGNVAGLSMSFTYGAGNITVTINNGSASNLSIKGSITGSVYTIV
jgi:hypothetical protein